MNTALQNKIIEQIKLSDDVILLEIQELLNTSSTFSIEEKLPLYVQQRLNKSLQQANEKQYTSHDDVMKKYKGYLQILFQLLYYKVYFNF